LGSLRLSLVPLVAVTVALGVAGIHGRRTHEPFRAARALETLQPTTSTRIAVAELDAFFEGGWVGWDVKTAAEIACGGVEARHVSDPLLCLARARAIVVAHERRERETYRNYTVVAWSALVPGLALLVVTVLLVLDASRRKRERPAA